MRAFIERIDIYSEKPDNNCWIRNIVNYEEIKHVTKHEFGHAFSNNDVKSFM